MNKLLNWKSVPLGGIIPTPGSAKNYKTGDWRTFKPIIDKQKCVKCLICWIYCPEPAIIRKEDDEVEIDYEFCKGCGICESECPVKAIRMEEE